MPIVPECRDPFDIPFLLLAIVGMADYLVTGDNDLLCLSDNFSCPILTVDQFLTVISYWTLEFYFGYSVSIPDRDYWLL